MPFHRTQQHRDHLYCLLLLSGQGTVHQCNAIMRGEEVGAHEQHDQVCLVQMCLDLLLAIRYCQQVGPQGEFARLDQRTQVGLPLLCIRPIR